VMIKIESVLYWVEKKPVLLKFKTIYEM